MPTVFVLSKLRKGTDPKKYESWVREYDYPQSKKIKSIVHYRTYRTIGALVGYPEYSYVEHIEINDVEEYKRDLETPVFKELARQWSEFIEDGKLIFAEEIQ